MTSDPTRLLEDPSAGAALRTDLAHAAEAELHGLDLAAGLLALQKATATVTSSTTAVAGTSLLAKLGIGAASVAAGAVVLWLGLSGGSDPGVVARTPAVSGTPEAPPPEEPPVLGEPARAATPRVGLAPAPVEPEPPRVDGATAAPVAEAPVAEAPVAGAPVTDEPERKVKPAPRRKASTVDRSGPEQTERSADPAADGVLREAKLVARARGSLARNPTLALALAEEAERDFPQGQLVEERRALAIRALVALGRLEEAQRRAEPFLAEYGRGAHAAAVRRALEGDVDTP